MSNPSQKDIESYFTGDQQKTPQAKLIVLVLQEDKIRLEDTFDLTKQEDSENFRALLQKEINAFLFDQDAMQLQSTLGEILIESFFNPGKLIIVPIPTNSNLSSQKSKISGCVDEIRKNALMTRVTSLVTLSLDLLRKTFLTFYQRYLARGGVETSLYTVLTMYQDMYEAIESEKGDPKKDEFSSLEGLPNIRWGIIESKSHGQTNMHNFISNPTYATRKEAEEAKGINSTNRHYLQVVPVRAWRRE